MFSWIKREDQGFMSVFVHVWAYEVRNSHPDRTVFDHIWLVLCCTILNLSLTPFGASSAPQNPLKTAKNGHFMPLLWVQLWLFVILLVWQMFGLEWHLHGTHCGLQGPLKPQKPTKKTAQNCSKWPPSDFCDLADLADVWLGLAPSWILDYHLWSLMDTLRMAQNRKNWPFQALLWLLLCLLDKCNDSIYQNT